MSEEGDAQHNAEPPPPAQKPTVTPNTPPPKPNPSADPKLESQARTPPPLHFRTPTTLPEDLFHVTPLAALRLLSAAVEALVNVTGDIPPTPPLSSPTIPHMSGMAREKAAIVRSHSNQDLARVLDEAKADNSRSEGGFFDQTAQQAAPIDGVHLRASPTPPPSTDPIEPYIVIGANSQPLNLQHSAITRKFYSKKPPPISISDYLARIHHYCPMSTAVYLATSYYIFRLAVEERAIAVTGRNCHRLLLAGLRVAMKALEDLSYPHAKFARVGGVSEVELGRLEINFCFLAGFELMVTEEVLRKHWESLKENKASAGSGGGGLGGLQGGLSALKLTHRRKITAESVAG